MLPDLRSPIDRQAHLRDDEAELTRRLAQGKIILFNGSGFALKPASADEKLAELLELSAHQISASEIADFTYLGQFEGKDYFLHLALEAQENFNWAGLRQIGDSLPLYQYFLALHSQAIGNWHLAAKYCSYCGSETKAIRGGSVRLCLAEEREIFPRTDPAIITLLYDENERILLGRQSVWEENRYSNFAGFVEVGESFEETVAREAKEEAGVDVVDIKYLGSQPWPFPQSEMIAFTARVLDPASAKADGVEIESLRWYSRKELAQDLATGKLTLPPRVSVSRKMIEDWYGGVLE